MKRVDWEALAIAAAGGIVFMILIAGAANGAFFS